MVSSVVTEQPPLHPLLLAGKWIALDLLSTLVFVGVYMLTGSFYAAIGVGVGIGVAQVVVSRWRGLHVDTIQWLSLGLVVVFGGASMLTQDARFIMLKPTLIYAVVGCVMLKPGWINRYMPPIALERAGDITFVFGFIWSGLMFATAAANLVLALAVDVATWAWFVAVFPIASKVTMVLVQYGVTRFIVQRRERAAGRGLADIEPGLRSP